MTVGMRASQALLFACFVLPRVAGESTLQKHFREIYTSKEMATMSRSMVSPIWEKRSQVHT